MGSQIMSNQIVVPRSWTNTQLTPITHKFNSASNGLLYYSFINGITTIILTWI